MPFDLRLARHVTFTKARMMFVGGRSPGNLFGARCDVISVKARNALGFRNARDTFGPQPLHYQLGLVG